MSTTYHDPIASNAAATAATLNYPLGQLDQAIADLGSTAVNDLSDVVIDGTPADNELLAYDTSSGDWINQTAAEAGLAAASHAHDADDVTYTPAVLADWDGSADPGNTGAGLDQLAERVTDLENPTAETTIWNLIIDGGGATIATGTQLWFAVPYACTITEVTLLANASGSIVVDLWKDTYANFPPTDADTITASAPPTLSSAQKSQDTTLTGWTKALSQGDILLANVDSATTVTRVTLAIKVTKS